MELIPAAIKIMHIETVTNFRVVSLIICVLSSVILSTIVRRRRRLPLPPGPKSFPFVGYSFGPWSVLERISLLLFFTPAHKHFVLSYWRQMEKITEKYGPVSSVKLGNNKLLVIVGRVQPALALLEGRSSIYCDRPQLGELDRSSFTKLGEYS